MRMRRCIRYIREHGEQAFAEEMTKRKCQTMKLKIMKNICHMLLLVWLVSCGASTDKKAISTDVEQNSVADKTLAECAEKIDLINIVYDKFVFAIDADDNFTPEKYFSANALKKLREDYEFDCEEGSCYAYYALRTEMQDSKPGSEGISEIYSIEYDGDDWYLVSYSDMGWPGKTRIKIIDGKVDDYKRMKP